MKKIIRNLVAVICIAGLALVGCKSSTEEEKAAQEKVQDAEENVQDAKENVQDAKDSLVAARKEATAEEWRTFKKGTDSIIKYNEAQIAELKLKMKKTGKSIDAKYEKNIEVLEQKNKNLKVKMETYKNDANADWQSFKSEFNHDMNKIGQALKDLTIDNKK